MTTTKVKRVSLGTKPDILERRQMVARLKFVKRWTNEQICTVLKISNKTLTRDLGLIKAYGEDKGKDIMEEPLERILWELKENYNERQQLRWQEFSNAKKPNEKVRILNDIQAEEQQFNKMLQSMGVIYQAPEKVDLRNVESWADLANLADETDHEAAG